MHPKLDVIGIVVDDMARSLAFYRELGFDLPPEADQAPHPEAEVAGGLHVAWDTVDTIRSFAPDWQPPSGGHRIALAFRCATPAEVDATHDRLVSLGHKSHLAPWDAEWGMRYAVILDPDGNAVDFFCENT